MSLLLDTGPIVAALNKADDDHERCAALFDSAVDLLIPSPVLVEVDYWLTKLAGPDAWSSFVADIVRGAYRVIHPTETDIERAAELETEYLDLDLGFVDASVIAICERLGKKACRNARPTTLLSHTAAALLTLHTPTRLKWRDRTLRPKPCERARAEAGPDVPRRQQADDERRQIPTTTARRA